jgi:hypothetical protein
MMLASVLALGTGCPRSGERRVQHLASVADAPRHDPEAEALRFTAELRPDLAGYHSWTVTATRHVQAAEITAAMIPVVPSGWLPDAPVPLWLRVDARTADPASSAMRDAIADAVHASRQGPLEVTIVQHLEAEVDMGGTNAFQIGARRAMDEHGLSSPIGAPLTVDADGP